MEQGKQLSATQARAVIELIDRALMQKHVRQELTNTKAPSAKLRCQRELRRVDRTVHAALVDVVRSGVDDLAMIGSAGFSMRGAA